MGTSQLGNTQIPSGTPGGWLPYLNLLQGIRMDYPHTWMVQEQSTPVQFAAWFGSPQQGVQDPFQENLTVTVQPVFPGTSQDTFVQGWQALAQQAGVQIVEQSSATLAGRNAHRVLFHTPPQPPTGQPHRVLLFLFLIDVRGYSVMYTGQQPDFDRFLPTVQQMLASLQVHSRSPEVRYESAGSSQ